MALGNPPRNKADYERQVEQGMPGEPGGFMQRGEDVLIGQNPFLGQQQQEGGQVMSADQLNNILAGPSPEVLAKAEDPTADTSGGRSERTMRRFQVRNGPDGARLANQDFNPAGYTPNQSRSTSVGKYGGSPLFAATLAAPFAVYNDRMRASAERDAEIAKTIKQFDPNAGIKDPQALKYKDTINNWGADQIDSYVDNIIARYGDTDGITRLQNPSTSEARGFEQMKKHINTVIDNIDSAVANSHAVQAGMDQGALEYNEDLYHDAQEVEQRLGGYEANNDPEELARILPKFNARVSLSDAMVKQGFADALKNAGSTQKVFEMVQAGDPLFARGFSTLLSKKTVTRDSVIDSLTDYLAPKYKNELSRDEVRKVVSSYTSNLYEEDVERAAIPGYGTKSGSSDGGGTESGSFGAYQYGRVEGEPTEGDFHQIRLSHLSAGKGKLPAPVTVSNPNPKASDKFAFLHPETVFESENGNLYIAGKVGKEPGTRVVQGEDGQLLITKINPVTGEETKVSEQEYFNTLQPLVVPYNENKGALESILPGMNERSIRRMLNEGRGSSAQPAAAEPAAAAPAAQYFTDPKVPPPVRGAKYSEKGGGWFVQKAGSDKWVRVAK